MNERKLKSLFAAVRGEATAEVPFGFHRSVLAAIRSGAKPLRVSLSDQLASLFPRIAFAALLTVGLCTAADIYFTDNEPPLNITLEQVAADDWLVAGK